MAIQGANDPLGVVPLKEPAGTIFSGPTTYQPPLFHDASACPGHNSGSSRSKFFILQETHFTGFSALQIYRHVLAYGIGLREQ